VRIATVGEVTDRRTDRHTDGSDFIICPMLCYSNGMGQIKRNRMKTANDIKEDLKQNPADTVAIICHMNTFIV